MNKMMMTVILMLMSFTAFGAMSTEITDEYVMPDEMQGCKIFYLQGGGVSHADLYVTRCPNAQAATGFRSGNRNHRVVSGNRNVLDNSDPDKEIIEINGSKYVKVLN